MTIEYMDVKEFRELGYLQELNRRLLHPLGLALEITIEENGDEIISGVWNYREHEEGVYYNIQNSDQKRYKKFIKNKEYIDDEFKKREKQRKKLLGFIVEPIDKGEEYESSK